MRFIFAYKAATNQPVFQGKMANIVQNGGWKVLPWVVKKKHKPVFLEHLLGSKHGAQSWNCRPALKETFSLWNL